jgi:lipoprotein-anchoring transpeptidase ErfK/SrfK
LYKERVVLVYKEKHLSSVYRSPSRKINLKAIIALLFCLICIGLITTFIIVHHSKVSKPTIKSSQKTTQTTKLAQSSAINSQSTTSSSQVTVNSSKASSESTAEKAIQLVQISLQNSAKPLWIDVSIANQNVTVYDANNKVIESYICSTGSPGYDTPTGTFTVYNRGKSFFSQKYHEGGYYWVAFYEDYYFHSVPFDKNGQIIPSVAKALGTEDSHGCVHLSIPNSEWIYDNIPNGTKVVVE